jgi:hypothetical protein
MKRRWWKNDGSGGAGGGFGMWIRRDKIWSRRAGGFAIGGDAEVHKDMDKTSGEKLILLLS